MLTKNFERLQSEVASHVKADRVAQGSYKTCFIGCLAKGHDDPEFIENEYGIPLMVTRIAESIFEGLPADEAILFFAAIPQAIGSDGKDLTLVGWKFLATELRSFLPVADDTKAVINSVINGMDLLGEGKEWPKAAAWSSITRATASHYSDANAAARAAAAASHYSDADTAARSASEAAWFASAAWYASAARLRQRDTLLRLIKEDS